MKTYWNRKGGARQFILADLSKNTKLSQAINENRIQYINDLKELRNDIDQRLKDLQRQYDNAIVFFINQKRLDNL